MENCPGEGGSAYVFKASQRQLIVNLNSLAPRRRVQLVLTLIWCSRPGTKKRCSRMGRFRGYGPHLVLRQKGAVVGNYSMYDTEKGCYVVMAARVVMLVVQNEKKKQEKLVH